MVLSAEELFVSWVKEKIESKVFDNVIIFGDFTIKLNFIEKLDDSFITQVFDFETFSSGNVLDLGLVSEPVKISEIFKRPPIGDIMSAHIVLELNFANHFYKKVENIGKMKDLTFNTASDKNNELIAAVFEQTD